MAIKIHHGPNGSYKTSGAIQDDLIPAIKKGRVIITNIRGLTRDRVFQVFPKTPDSFEVINLSLEDDEDIERMRTWFLWAPRGAFIIFDETQLVFPKSWNQAYLSRFDYPGGRAQAKADDRPTSWLDAWTRHRHFNWDVILTTPNIDYIRDDIRMTCEMAYLHSNLAVIGVGGRYKETQHSAQTSRPPVKDTIVEIKKIKPETFKLYDSTATGTVTDTIAGKSIFKQPKLLFFMALPAVLLGSLLFDSGGGMLMGGPPKTPVPGDFAPPVAVSPPDNPSRPGPSSGNALSDADLRSRAASASVDHPFSGFTFVIRGTLVSPNWSRVQFTLENSQTGEVHSITDDQLSLAGYAVAMRGDCVASVSYGTWTTFARCRSAADKSGAQRVSSGASAALSVANPGISVSGIDNTRGAIR